MMFFPAALEGAEEPALSIGGFRIRLKVEESLKGLIEFLKWYLGKVTNQPMSRENHQTLLCHIDEVHHHVIECLLTTTTPSFCAQVITVVQGSLIAMMAVGYQNGLVCHLALDRADDFIIGDLP